MQINIYGYVENLEKIDIDIFDKNKNRQYNIKILEGQP